MACHILLLFLVIATLGCSQSVSPPDALRREVTALRGIENLTAPQYAKLRQAAVDWVDGEILAGRDVASINQALKVARLVPTGADGFEFDPPLRDDNRMREISEQLHPLIRAVIIPIRTNQNCGFDQTALVYERQSGQRIAVLNANEVLDNGRYLVGLAAFQHPENDNKWTIASGWFVSWCTSSLTTAVLRVDRIAAGKQEKALFRSITARRNMAEVDLKVDVTASEASFQYIDTTTDAFTFPVMKRFALTSQPVKEFTYAKNLVGFVSRKLGKGVQDIEGLAVCEGAWEISIREQSGLRIFRFSGVKAEFLQFDGERKQLSPGCRAISDVNRVLEQLEAPLP